MSDWFSDEELDRIARFAASPGHSRDPTMLLPEDDSHEAAVDESGSVDEDASEE